MWCARGFPLALRLLLAVLAVGLVACEREAPPQLLSVTDLLPREAELGDRLELSGSGFPQGRTAEVRFRGALRRPGEVPESGVEIHAQGTVDGAQAIEVRYDEPLQARFCRLGDHLVHTTFVGEVEVAFPAAAVGAPPVTATLHGVHLDLRPPRAAHPSEAREAARFLAFLGIAVEDRAAPGGGLTVARIEPGSIAETSGLHPGDVLGSLDDLRLGEVADALPAPHAPRVTLGVRRPGSRDDEPHPVSIAGYRPATSEDLLPAAVLLAAVLAWLVLFAAPPGPRRAWLEARLVARARAFASPLATSASLRRALIATVGLTGAAAAAIPLLPVRSTTLDLGTLGGPLATSLVGVALLAGRSSRTTWRARTGAALRASILELVIVAGLLTAVLAGGSVRVHDLVLAQGGAPWAWTAFRSPATWLAAALVVVALAAQGARVAAGSLVEAESLDTQRPSVNETFVVVEWLHLGGGSLLVAIAFFGGYAVPGVSTGALAARLPLQALGAVVLLAKTGAVAWLALRLRAALPAVSTRATVLAVARTALPLALCAALATQALLVWGPGHRVQALVSAVTLTLFLAACLHVMQRGRVADRSVGAGELDPFL